MLSISFPDPGTINATIPDPGDPTYQTECLALYLRQLFSSIYTEGFKIEAAEASDFTTFGGSLSDGLDDYIQRYEEILQNGFSEVTAALPDVLPIIGALLSGGGTSALTILLQGVLDTIVRHKNSGTTAAGGEIGEVDLSELTAKIDELKDVVELVMTEFEINIVSDDLTQSWHAGKST